MQSTVEGADALASAVAATDMIEAVGDGSTIAMPISATGDAESAPRVSHTAPPLDENAKGESSEGGKGGAGGETDFDHGAVPEDLGTAPASPAADDFPCKLQVWSSEDASCPKSTDGGGERCGSKGLPANGSAQYVARRDFALEDNEDDDGGPVAVIRMIGDDPAQKSFDPEKTTVSVGTTVVWKLCAAAGPESEVFHVRPECLVIKDGWQTECSFSLRDAQPSFSHTFKEDGVFMVYSVTSTLDDDNGEKKGVIVVEKSESQCDSDSFDPTDSGSLDNIQPGSETPPSGNVDSGGRLASFLRDSERSATAQAEVAQLSDPNLSSSPAGGKWSASSAIQDVGAMPPIHTELASRSLSARGSRTYRSVGPTASLPAGTEMEILAATAAARAGASKSKTEAGSHRNIAPLQGTPTAGGGGDGGGSGGGRGGVKSETDLGKNNADVDGSRVAHPEALVPAPRPPRVDAAVQSGELLWPPSNRAIAEAAPSASTGRQPTSSPETPIDGTDEDELVGSTTKTTSKSKKRKKKKKKSGGGGGVVHVGRGDGDTGSSGGGGDGAGGSRGTGWDVPQGSGFDASKIGGGLRNELALLLDERTFSSIFPDRAVGVKGGAGGKSVAKTLIVGDEGFKPAKALVVQAEDAVSIKAAAVRRNGGYGHDRALSISLELPDVHPSKVIASQGFWWFHE